MNKQTITSIVFSTITIFLIILVGIDVFKNIEIDITEQEQECINNGGKVWQSDRGIWCKFLNGNEYSIGTDALAR